MSMALSVGTQREIRGRGSPGRLYPDWIDQFTTYAAEPNIPPIFIKWSAIGTVAAILERRVWCHTREEPLFPNMYVMLVGPPAGGKSTAINRAARLARYAVTSIGPTRHIKFAPDDITKAALVDSMAKARVAGAEGFIQTPLFLAADELSTAINFMAPELLTFLTKMYDGPDNFDEQRRSRGDKALNLEKPIMNVLTGVQPGFLAQHVPEYAWDQGRMARFTLVYADPISHRKVFTVKASEVERDKMQIALGHIFDMSGKLEFTATAVELMEYLNATGMQPAPTHHRLHHYKQRRTTLFIAKL